MRCLKSPTLAPSAIVLSVLSGLLSLALLVTAMLNVTQAGPTPDVTPTTFWYLPLVISDPSCPITSTNVYESGTAYQYDLDDPVRPAHDHADKNIELRGYAPATDPGLQHELIDYGCDDEDAPQLATLFRPHRVPPLTTLYQVNQWSWADSPDPGAPAGPIANPPVTALGLETIPGEVLQVPESGYEIGGGMEVIVLFADEDTVALRYAREDSAGAPGYVLHIDEICTDPSLLSLYRQLDDPGGPRYVYQSPEERPYVYPLPNLSAGYPIGTAATTETVVAVVDTGVFQDPRSLAEWWRIRPGLEVLGVEPGDNDYAKQWPLEIVDAPNGWAISTGEEIVIAVIDTGVDLDHPDLEGKLLVDLGKSFIDQAPTPDDDHGHGTHVAGIAAAATDNSLGIAGVGWDASILPLKVLDRTGEGTFVDVAAAIDYAADLGVDVINLSLGPESGHSMACDQFLQREIDEAYAAGAVIVAAAGNNGGRIEIPPANCDHVLGVAATTREDTLPSYSASGPHVSVAAPGGTYDCYTCAIYSTLRGGSYGWLAGTSMATPHVSGLAALILERYPGYTPDQVASAILDNALDMGESGYDENYGCGRIDAYAALSAGAHGPDPHCLEGVAWTEQRTGARAADAPHARFAPGEILVELRPGSSAAAFSQRYQLGGIRLSDVRMEHLPALDVWRLHIPPGRERAILALLQADPAVLHAQLNYLVVVQ